MIIKKEILFILSVAILGFANLSCKKADTDLDKPENIEEAFEKVVKVLHAPYEKGSLFFKIFTGEGEVITTEEDVVTSAAADAAKAAAGDASSDTSSSGAPEGAAPDTTGTPPGSGPIKAEGVGEKEIKAIVERKNGADSSQIGEGTNPGKGVWFVKAGSKSVDAAIGGGGRNNSILYQYKKYQPPGSDIHVSGTMKAMYRSKTPNADAIGFNKNPIGSSGFAAVLLIDTLKIDGAYKAVLKFSYPMGFTYSNITKENYDQLLFDDDSQAMFSDNKSRKPVAKVEFSYEKEAILLNKEQLRTLLKVG